MLFDLPLAVGGLAPGEHVGRRRAHRKEQLVLDAPEGCSRVVEDLSTVIVP